MMEQAASFAAAWERIHDLCSVLRGEDGCRWDRAQTVRTLLPFLVEEIHELVEAHQEESRQRLVEEAGDVVYILTFFLQLLEEEQGVAAAEIAGAAEEKLIRRHPHVFEREAAPNAGAPRAAWEIAKREEREERGERAEVLAKLPASLTALASARRLQEKAAAYSFDWSEPREVVAKIREEIDELSEAVDEEGTDGAVAEELGDLLFAVVNLSRHLGRDPEAALAAANEKFRDRFNRMAASVEASGLRLGEVPLHVLEDHWTRIKSQEPRRTPPVDRR
ncbi:MAG: nucleoside triphosphate pyrophosphohydrolase [Candidatus Eisenbacteria bacterium]|nr:nucleoside triphosphate pyrophosphohydrolase [Candidatus Latescibacterota bacterium]MBD3302062.1 nucleoside triphosphate pyrophosphohydrolase [Candidatus Eisenbacteria bacterium]